MTLDTIIQSAGSDWTLFLDRDGVLNKRVIDGYVCSPNEWEWLPGALDALRILSARFGKIIVITNQRGIAKGLYSETDLKAIHNKMLADVESAGGRIDAIYHCPHEVTEECKCRKPQPGMILMAARDFQEIDLRKAIMVGDSPSDMEAAAAAGIPGIEVGKPGEDRTGINISMPGEDNTGIAFGRPGEDQEGIPNGEPGQYQTENTALQQGEDKIGNVIAAFAGLKSFADQFLETQQAEHSLDQEYWDRRWKEENTPWDMGQASPPLVAYFSQLKDRQQTILIPGAGNAYEAEWLWKNGFTGVSVLDWSGAAVERLLGRIPGFPKRQAFAQDFFEHEGQYDLIVEQTFFCAINPDLRTQYRDKMFDLLKPGGRLAGLLFDFPLSQGPPFGGSADEYRALFDAAFEVKTMERCYNSIPPRAGSELFFVCLKE